jgi:hypothetical protein
LTQNCLNECSDNWSDKINADGLLQSEAIRMVNSLPEDTSFTVAYLVNNAILLLANRHIQQLEDIGRRKLHLHFDDFKCDAASHV